MSVLDEMSPTDMSPMEYVVRKGMDCPACRGGDVIPGQFDAVEPDLLIQSVLCRDCGAYWDDEYHLVTYSDLKYNTKED